MSVKTRRLADTRVGASLLQVDVYICVCVSTCTSVAVKSGQLGRILTCVGQMEIAVCSLGARNAETRATAPLPPHSGRVLDYSAPKSGEDLPRWVPGRILLLAYVCHELAHFKDMLKIRRWLNEIGRIGKTNIQGTNCKPNRTKWCGCSLWVDS